MKRVLRPYRKNTSANCRDDVRVSTTTRERLVVSSKFAALAILARDMDVCIGFISKERLRNKTQDDAPQTHVKEQKTWNNGVRLPVRKYDDAKPGAIAVLCDEYVRRRSVHRGAMDNGERRAITHLPTLDNPPLPTRRLRNRPYGTILKYFKQSTRRARATGFSLCGSSP